MTVHSFKILRKIFHFPRNSYKPRQYSSFVWGFLRSLNRNNYFHVLEAILGYCYCQKQHTHSHMYAIYSGKTKTEPKNGKTVE